MTGGGGFLGSRVVERLRASGAREVSVPRSAEYDLTRWRDAERLFDDLRPEIVIHLAGKVGGIGFQAEHGGELFYDNAMMGLQTMELARRRGVEKFVAVGSVCAYPKHAPVPLREDDLWSGYPDETSAAYGLAKRMLLVQAQSYRRQYGFNAVYLLPVNLYGPGDDFDSRTSHVIPALIRKCLEAQAAGETVVEVWGSGRASREFVYVDDAARAVVLATERYDAEEPVNIGSGREVTIAELAELIARLTGFQGELRWDATKPDGQPRRSLDTSRAERAFGFRAEVALEEGIGRVIAWYRDQVAGAGATRATGGRP